MRPRLPLTIAAATVAAVLTLTVAATSPDATSIVRSGVGPTLQSIGPLAIGPAGTLYAADPQAASIVALDLSAQPAGAPGTKDIDGIDQKIAAMLGTAASEITITDLKVEPKSHNSFIAVMRGKGATTSPALLRVDGDGKIDLVSLEGVKFTSVALPNAPDANPEGGRSNRSQSITNIAFNGGKVYVAGLSNEEFASKLWAVAYPFVDGRPRHQRRDLPRLARPARDAFAGLHLHPLHGERRAGSHRGVPVHAARSIPGLVAPSRARRSAARRSPSSAPATGRSTWSCTRRTAMSICSCRTRAAAS